MRRLLAFWCVFALTAVSASAQDLFELEVFEYATAEAGGIRYDVALHTGVISRGGVMPASAAGNHRPAHVSLEVARGWMPRFESAIFIHPAPFGSSGSARFAGGHLRSKCLGALPTLPLRIAVSVEYAFNRTAFDHERQTFEVRSIVDYSAGRLTLVANPSLEVVTHGSPAAGGQCPSSRVRRTRPGAPIGLGTWPERRPLRDAPRAVGRAIGDRVCFLK